MAIGYNYNFTFPELEDKKIVSKLVFLSYHIALYKTISESMGFNSQDISVEEIYDFIQDLKENKDKDNKIPSIEKIEISFCFHILESMGICHSK
jgi:hypothetical protein